MTFVYNLLDGELDPDDDPGPEGHRFREYRVAHHAGAKLTGVCLYEVPAGEAVWPYHFETNEEEWLIVVEGEVTLRTPDGERVLRAGDVACFPAGAAGAHAVRNASSSVARFAMPSTEVPRGGAVIYPDSGKYSIYGPGFRQRGRLGEPVGYWDGEV
jgi:uncharacterized cupin superfamily protein